MRLINVKAFLERESLIGEGKAMDRRVKVLDFGDDEETEYAILSHRWIGQEVDHDEIVDLAKMAVEERDEIRQRGGYRKILDTCGQAQKDGYEWLWVDTCCIDKRSSAELHDVPGSSFPTASDDERYRGFSGWPEWFSRGWTLQELIAPSNIQFLQDITRIPEHILMHGLHGNRPCVAQIMSWTADRKTTRVEDRAYSLMGLLDVNMPMLYGEGKKAFHRLQLEIIRASNDQSIFAWYGPGDEPGSVLADDPSCFWSCDRMELMGHDEFVRYFKEDVSDEELDFVQDRLGTFPITNRGIQIWMLLHPEAGSPTFFKARLPCRGGPWDRPVTITLTLWESNYYRYRGPSLPFPTQFGPPQFRQVYLGYQSLPHPNTTFEIDDSALTENGFTYRAAYPMKFSGDTLTLTSTDPLCAKVYSDSVTDHCLVVSLGKSSGQDWIYVVSDESNTIPRLPWQNYIAEKYYETRFGAPGHTRQRMDLARPGAERYGQIFIMQTRLPQSTRILRISSVSWKSSRMCAVKLEVFHDPSFSEVSGKWAAFDVDGADDPGCDWQGLMVLHQPREYRSYKIHKIPGNFSATPDGLKLGDYGHFTDSEEFRCEGNLFVDLKSLSLTADITPRQHEISSISDVVIARDRMGSGYLSLYKPLMLSLPSNDDLKSLLTPFSTRLTNRYLVIRTIQCPPHPSQPDLNITTSLYSVAKPFVWHQNESAGFVSEERSGDELGSETKGDQVRVNDIDEVKS